MRSTHARRFRGSNCRPHPCSPSHASLFEGYWMARHAWDLACEAFTLGCPVEEARFRAANPPPTFRDWLLGSRSLLAVGHA